MLVGGENIKNKQKAISIILLTVVFLMPFMGNTVVSARDGYYTWYFDSYHPFLAWETYPASMTDGKLTTFARTTTDGDVQQLTRSTYEPTHEDGTITKVEIRANGKWTGEQQGKIILTPVFGGIIEGDDHYFSPAEDNANWSEWFDITDDTNAPDPWRWVDIDSLDCLVEADIDDCTLHCSKVELRVHYTT